MYVTKSDYELQKSMPNLSLILNRLSLKVTLVNGP